MKAWTLRYVVLGAVAVVWIAGSAWTLLVLAGLTSAAEQTAISATLTATVPTVTLDEVVIHTDPVPGSCSTEDST